MKKKKSQKSSESPAKVIVKPKKDKTFIDLINDNKSGIPAESEQEAKVYFSLYQL